MQEHSIEMLEFPKIREILAGYTAFALSREIALTLQPSTYKERISHALQQSTEARHLLSIEPDISIGGVFDIREALTLAARGKVLETKTLLDIQSTLIAIRYLINRFNRLKDEAPLLANISSRIISFPELEREIGRCISPNAELLDTASTKLFELRQLLKEKRLQILSRLDSIIKSQDNDRYIQEQIITERDGRYVIPVKIELRREMKGIVHDISNTGATAFVEPLSIVDMGNELREMVIEEQREAERILASLSASIGDEEAALNRNLKLVAEIDFALAKARYAEKIGAIEPQLCGTFDAEGKKIENKILRLVNARHPLLKGKPVPLTIEIGKDFKGLVITGPNTGGKTVALKTIGILALMTQAGIPIPASGDSRLPIFDNIFADIGDEQSIEQTLSSFSWHICNIVRILAESTDHSLVLLDELGTSTDPGEGAALAQSILLHFMQCDTMIIATSHFSELKAFAHATSGLQNASLDFDPISFKPTYHLTLGIPGGSNALAIAGQLGLPAEIIRNARERLSKGSIEIETLLTDLMSQKQKVDIILQDIEKKRLETENIRSQLQREKQELKDKEREILGETRRKLVREGDELLKEIKDVMSELRKARSQEKVEQARKALDAMRDRLSSQSWQPSDVSTEKSKEVSLIVGDKVWVKGMNLQGVIVSAVDSSGRLEIQVGTGKFKLSPENLEKAEAQGKGMASVGSSTNIPSKMVPRELDLRGKRADEVEIELDTYINNASLSGHIEVRIIHGIATGTVRQIVRQFLASHPLVESFRSGKKEEGGDGVTIVKL